MKDGQMTFKDVALGNLSTFNIMGTVVIGYEIGAINPAGFEKVMKKRTEADIEHLD